MTMWHGPAEPASPGAGAVTLVEGSSFCISAANGDIVPTRPHGVFYRDTRILSHWTVEVDGEPVEPLAAATPEPYRATFVGRLVRRFGGTANTLLVQRHRLVGAGLREDITVRNLGREPAACTVTVTVGADFADLFEVKDGRNRRRGQRTAVARGTRLAIDYRWREWHRGVVVDAAGPAAVTRDSIRYRIVVPSRGEWAATVVVRPVVDGMEIPAPFPADWPIEEAAPARRFQEWRLAGPFATADDRRVERVLRRSRHDLGALRIFDPDHPDRAVVAAGAPWFMALFGRDSLLASWMTLPVDRFLALGTLRTLAEHQGRRTDPLTEEEPGRILHEVRLGADTRLALGGGTVYYGTADATPLFVALLGELRRWGVGREELAGLLPHADRALEWVQRYGDRDGDGFVEYQRATDQGLANQGWKDSWDGISFADGRLAEAPIALCEVQGYVYSAYLARSHLAAEAGDEEQTRHWVDRASALRRQFNERFWLPDRGYYAIALDRDKRPVDSCASNMGHCLWTGLVDPDKAPLVAERLLSDEMFTGWGLRTLASDMGRYDPASYHNGSVWPHDTALAAAGLMRYGFVEHAQRLAVGLFEAADAFDGRLPELFCGFGRNEYPEPVPYPTSCSPQAWAAAAPLHLIRTLLRFDPCVPRDRLWLAPALPPGFGRLHVRDVPLAGLRLSVHAQESTATVDGLPDRIEVVPEPRPLTATQPE